MTNKSKFNISDIFRNHLETLRSPAYKNGNDTITIHGKISLSDKFIFYLLPILVSIICTTIIGRPAGELVTLYTATLSLFIGLFLNMLVLIISTLKPNYDTRDKTTRKQLIEFTFYNIAYTVIASLIALGCLFLSLIELFPESSKIPTCFLQTYLSIPCQEITTNSLVQNIFSLLFYYMLVKIILTLLMILKKTYTLFKIDIKNSQ